MTIKRIDAEEAFAEMQDGKPYVDVRTSMEFEAGHPIGSYHIPFGMPDPATGMMMLNPDFVDVISAHFGKDDTLLLGCKAGGRSAHAASLLAQHGFTSLIDVGPGWSGGPNGEGRMAPGWATCGLPTADGDGADRSYATLTSKLD